MEDKKFEELKSLEELVRNKMSERERVWMLGNMSSRIVCALAKHLIKNEGYGVVTKIVQKELRELGKNDAKRLMKIFELNDKTPQTASKALKIAALILGMKLDVQGNETIISECPHGNIAKELHEPFYCSICKEYCKGIVNEVIGDDYTFLQVNNLLAGDNFCAFQVKKRV